MTILLLAILAFAIVLGIAAAALILLRRQRDTTPSEPEVDEDRPTQVEN